MKRDKFAKSSLTALWVGERRHNKEVLNEIDVAGLPRVPESRFRSRVRRRHVTNAGRYAMAAAQPTETKMHMTHHPKGVPKAE